MSAGGIPWNDQPLSLLHALGTAFLDGCVFLACPKHTGDSVRILGVGTDAPRPLVNLSSCFTRRAELHFIYLMLATVSGE